MGSSKPPRAVTRKRQPTIAELFDDGRAIDRALRLGVRDALLRHRLLGQKVAVWQDGRVVVLEPEQIPVAMPNKAGTSTPSPRRRTAWKRSKTKATKPG